MLQGGRRAMPTHGHAHVHCLLTHMAAPGGGSVLAHVQACLLMWAPVHTQLCLVTTPGKLPLLHMPRCAHTVHARMCWHMGTPCLATCTHTAAGTLVCLVHTRVTQSDSPVPLTSCSSPHSLEKSPLCPIAGMEVLQVQGSPSALSAPGWGGICQLECCGPVDDLFLPPGFLGC